MRGIQIEQELQHKNYMGAYQILLKSHPMFFHKISGFIIQKP